ASRALREWAAAAFRSSVSSASRFHGRVDQKPVVFVDRHSALRVYANARQRRVVVKDAVWPDPLSFGPIDVAGGDARWNQPVVATIIGLLELLSDRRVKIHLNAVFERDP